MYRTHHLTETEHTFFSSTYRSFSRIDYLIKHETNVSKFNKTEIITSIFSDHMI